MYLCMLTYTSPCTWFNLPVNALSHGAQGRHRTVQGRVLMSRRAFRRCEALTDCNGYRTVRS
jgi:hypothetical protein